MTKQEVIEAAKGRTVFFSDVSDGGMFISVELVEALPDDAIIVTIEGDTAVGWVTVKQVRTRSTKI
jgi:hypothetical protein